jgi:hypothetical protein
MNSPARSLALPFARPALPALGILALALTAITLPADRVAAAALQYAWGPCDSGTISYPWFGPGRYQQSLCATGLASDVRSVHVTITVGPAVADAWQFSPPSSPTSCEPASAFQYDGLVVGAASAPIPAVQASFMPHLTDPRFTLQVDASYEPAAPPDPARVTAVGHVVFDLSNATVAPGIPGTCPGAAIPMCFAIVSATATHAGGSTEALALAQDSVRWNDPANSTACPGSVPATPRTWGMVKAQYR